MLNRTALRGGVQVRGFFLFAASSLLLSSTLFGKPQEWPKWLGPNGDGIATDSIGEKWPADGPRKIWEQKVGQGYSSPIALDGRIYLFSQDGTKDILTTFEADNGKPLWSQSYEVTIRADGGQAKNGDSGMPLPLATPTIDNGRIYTYGGGGDLVCRKLEDGAEIWRLNVLNETHEHILTWNESSSPLVTDKFVYVQGGKGGPTAVAVDKETGKIAWQSQARTVGGYTAPILIEVDGTKQLIIFAGDQLYGMNPEDGKTIWAMQWKTGNDVNASTPVYRDHHLFISSDYGHGCMMLALTATGAKEDFDKADKDLMLKFQPAILDGDYLYANSGGTLKCAHWPDLKIQWEEKLKLGEGGMLVRDGELLVCLSERGKLELVHATPQSVKMLSQILLFDFGTVWSTPLIYHGKLYAMGKDTLVCLDLGGSQTASGVNTSSQSLVRAN
jgi:outer membrane protein assembly factor BamB